MFSEKFDSLSDLFSLGCVIFEIYGEALIKSDGSVDAYKKVVENLTFTQSHLPAGLSGNFFSKFEIRNSKFEIR